MAFVALSAIPVPLLLRSSRKVPAPEIVFTVTSYTEPLTEDTADTVPVAVSVVVSEKSEMSTPVTASLKVTRKVTLVELVVSDTGLFLLMLLTDGEAVSHAATVFPVASAAMALPAVSAIVPFPPVAYVTFTPADPAELISATVSTNRVTCPGTGRAYRVGIRCAGFGHRETAVVCF
jgi:hypothetical protein